MHIRQYPMAPTFPDQIVSGESKPWVMIAPVISTAHLPQEECDRATQELGVGFDNNLTEEEANNMFGFTVELTDEDSHNNHLGNFPTVMRLALRFRKLGYNYLRFDAAGDRLTGIKYFNW